MRRQMLILSVAIALLACADRVAVREPITPENDRQGGVSGVIRDGQSRTPLPNALVILQGGTPPQSVETMTNSRGVYWFPNLEAGRYTLEVLYGAAVQTRVFTHDGTTRIQADFTLDPAAQRISAAPERQRATTSKAPGEAPLRSCCS